MSIISRYIVAELVKVFAVTLIGMTTLMIMVGLIQEAIQENLTPLTILQLIPFVVPNALCFAIPGTILFSVCSVYGRMASSNELVSARALGISPMAMIWPALVFAFLLSLATVYLNDIAVSWGRQGVYRVVLGSVEKTIYSVLNTERSYNKGRISITVEDVIGKDLIHPTIEIHSKGNKAPVTLTAQKAQLTSDSETNELVFTVVNCVFEINENTKISLDEWEAKIPLRDATKKGNQEESPSNIPLRLIRKSSRDQLLSLEDRKKNMATKSAFHMFTGNMVALTHPQWQTEYTELQQEEYRQRRLYTEPWRRWANGFSCLCFVMVGIPLSINRNRADFWTTFGVCFMPILLSYYPLLMLGVSKAKSGQLPPQCVWLGNIALFIVGYLMIRKLLKR